MRIALVLVASTAACGFSAPGSCPSASCTEPVDARIDSPNGGCVPAWSYTPTNFSPCVSDPPGSPPLTLDNGIFRLTPQTGVLTKDGSSFATLVAGGTSLRRVTVDGLVITSSATLEILGTDPLLVVVNGAATIDGKVTASAIGTMPGAGAAPCSAMKGSDADSLQPKSAGAGGGGGAFGTNSAAGGTGDSTTTPTLGGTAMTAQGSPDLIPLRGGCGGGGGGEEHATAMATPGAGGGGGGALQISVKEALTIGATARIQANGGGGGGAHNIANGTGTHAGAGGGGGGSGGALFLEGRMVMIAAAAVLCANGGGGGGGSHDGNDGAPGGDGQCALAAATGGTGNGAGGNGSFATTNATPGDPGGGADGGGGGGGGGAGRIRVHRVTGNIPSGFISTPLAVVD